MKTYNGHRSWNAWNVALWMGNDESLYRIAMDCIKEARERCENGISTTRLVSRAARFFISMVEGKTPDGAKYNHLSVRLCLESFIDC